MELYPLKFKPIYKERVWGGNKLTEVVGRKKNSDKTIGESWELSSVEGDLSVVSNGFLKGNNIQEIIEIYMGDLVGEKVYDRFGIEFPLLFKFIDSNERLSLQVHPDDATALERHGAYGKTEMWYVVDADKDSRIYVGFDRKITAEEYRTRLENATLEEILNVENPKKDDVFFLPAGRIHALGEGLLIAEIQQTSDITYRIYDWGRENNPETLREMHPQQAQDVIDYNSYPEYGTKYSSEPNKTVNLATCQYFTTNRLHLTQKIERDYAGLDSFVVYTCIDGNAKIECGTTAPETIGKGETVLIPAIADAVGITPENSVKLLETYIRINQH